MATVTVYSAARMAAIEAASVVSGSINGSGRLILSRNDGGTIDAGNVVGPQGIQGPTGDQLTSVKLSTDPPAAYPVGLSRFSIATESGWPATYAQIFTVNTNASRAFQILMAKVSGEFWWRTADDNTSTWTAWQQTASKSYVDTQDAANKSYFDNHPMIKGANIPGSADLNTYTSNGFYVQVANAQAATGTNYPRALAGVLDVRTNPDAPGGFVWQKYTIYGGYNPENYVRTYYNGVWTPWSQGGTVGTLVRVGRNLRTANTANATAEYNICTVTLSNPVNGDVYAVKGGANISPDTAGMFTGLRLKHATAAGVGGTQIANIYLDHRIVGRVVGGEVSAEFTYTGTTGATGYNVVLVGAPGGGGSLVQASATQPAYLYVDKLL